MGGAPAEGQDARHARTVLIVDDHAGFRRTVRRALELEGWEVVGEASGRRRRRWRPPSGCIPTLVLLDIGLPDESGFVVAAKLMRRRARTPSSSPRRATPPTYATLAPWQLGRGVRREVRALRARRSTRCWRERLTARLGCRAGRDRQ